LRKIALFQALQKYIIRFKFTIVKHNYDVPISSKRKYAKCQTIDLLENASVRTKD
jgi:hypothetical protein